MKKALKEYKEIIVEFFSSHWHNKTQILEMAKTDVIKTYRGAVLGWSWAIIKPVIRIFVYWFAIAIGLRASSTTGGVSYFAFLISGMIPWFYMNDLITGGTKVLRKYGYLVTKLRFPVMTIPTFYSLSNLMVHIVMLALTVGVLSISGYVPTECICQIPLYMLMMFVFFNVWGMFAGMLGAMSKDFINLVSSITMAFFWLSGILYSVDTLAEKHPFLADVMSWNPITIIVEGYRNSLVYNKWFWEQPSLLLHFLIVFVILTGLMLWAYRKLRKDIADVL